MDSKPKYLEFSYIQSYTLDLDQLEIDLTNVESWYIKWHTLYVEFVDGSEQEFDLNDYAPFSELFTDTKRPLCLWCFDENWEDAELGK